MKTKEKLRKKGLEKRSGMSRNEVKKKSKEIQEKVLEILDEQETVMTYVSYRNEVETDSLIEKLLQKKHSLAVPKTIGYRMKAYKIEGIDELEENNRGIREPEDAEEVSKASIDICIIPGVKFDKQRNRIGYGNGYYDRFLENFQGQKLGLTYHKLIEEKIPADEWDIPMDKIITEKKIIRVR